jgi:hypothetical protein
MLADTSGVGRAWWSSWFHSLNVLYFSQIDGVTVACGLRITEYIETYEGENGATLGANCLYAILSTLEPSEREQTLGTGKQTKRFSDAGG